MSPRRTTPTFVCLKLWFPTPNSWDYRGPSTMQSVRFCPHSLHERSPHFCFWLSSAAMAVLSRVFLILSPLQPSHLVFLMLEAWEKLLYQIVTAQWIHSFSCHMIFVILVTLPRRFIGLDNASVFCLALLFKATSFLVLLTFNFARHCGWHRNFTLSTRSLHEIRKFSTNSPLLLFFGFRRIRPHLSKSLATMCLVWRSFVFLSVSPCTMNIHPMIMHSIQWILWNLSTYLTILDLHQRSNNRRYFLHHFVQRCICSPGRVDVFQWNGKSFFSWHVQFDFGFHLITKNKIVWNSPISCVSPRGNTPHCAWVQWF